MSEHRFILEAVRPVRRCVLHADVCVCLCASRRNEEINQSINVGCNVIKQQYRFLGGVLINRDGIDRTVINRNRYGGSLSRRRDKRTCASECTRVDFKAFHIHGYVNGSF